jgi:hypothetical protein
MPADAWLALTGERELMAWAGARESAAAALIDAVVRQGWHAAGACEAEPLPPLEASQLDAAMQDADFIDRPHWSGACCETTSLTRTASPLLAGLKARYGNGLLVRLVARLTELGMLAGRLLPDGNAAALPGAAKAGSAGSGIGQAAAARGQLVHRVELVGGRIGSYRILAPTEWNFHPQGVVARALRALSGYPQQLERQAHLLIEAVDPCVGYELSVVQGAAGHA